MDEEHYYSNHASNSSHADYDRMNYTDDRFSNTYGGGKSQQNEARNGGIGNRQRKPHDTGIKLKRCPSYLLGKPLMDYDCSDDHQEPSRDTFIVLSRRAKTAPDQVHRYSTTNSLFFMGPYHPIRLCAIRILVHKYFELFVIMIILVNCIFLALDHPPEQAEYVFAAIYTAEMILKIIAKGFAFHSFAYLRDSWNALDFVVVIMGYVTLAPNIANFSGIRTIRVLRALRTISAMKGLKAMVNTLLRSMRMLSDVLVLFLFFLGVMALIGLQLFVGELRNKCVLNVPYELNMSYIEYASIEENWYMLDDEPVICGNSSSAIPCPTNYTCLPHAGPNPNYGYTNFDNIGWALVMSFQLLTMDYWENLYNKMIAAVGAGYVFYFICAIFFCSFYLLNLVLAIVALSYEQEIRAVVHESVQRRKAKKNAVSYPADEETLRTLRPLNKTVGAQILAIKAIRREIAYQIKQAQKSNIQRKESIFKKIGSKNTFKDVLEEKLKNDLFAQDMRCWPRFQRILLTAVDHPLFELAVNGFILANTVVLALYHYGINDGFKYVLDILNLVFTAIFLLEMVVKLMALGTVDYLQSRWNLFDGLIVVMSLIDTTFELAKFRESAGTSIFRTFRLVRILKLAQSWKTMGKLLATIANSVGPIGNITLILVLIIYIFAVMGVKVFGSSYTEEVFPDGIPRWNFKDFWHSFMVVFRILCGEWIEPLWDCMKATNPGAIVFFILSFVIGNFIVLNLFLALLLNAFDSEDEEEEEDGDEDGEDKEPFRDWLKRKLFTTRRWIVPLKNNVPQSTANGSATNQIQTPGKNTVVKATKPLPRREIESPADAGSNATLASLAAGIGGNKKNRPVGEIVITECFPEFLMAPFDCLPLTCYWWLRLRGRVRFFVEHRFFEWFILSLVFISSFVLVFEDVHLKDNPKLAYILDTLNYMFAIIFAIEFVLKITGLGIVEFFSSFWNFLDAFIVAISVACIVEDKELAVFRSLRTVRALRPLRAVSRLEGMKVVVNALFAAIPGIANVLLVSLLFWLIFSILGVQLFAGKFFKCLDDEGNRLPITEINNKTDCLAYADDGYRWENSKVNFDNVINGFLALFQVATFEGWMEVMDDAVDSRGLDMQPSDESNFSGYTYFVIFIIIGAFFVLNLFVGVIIDNFNTLKRKYDELSGMGMLLTDSQRKWVDMLKEAAKRKAPVQAIRPQDCLRGRLFDAVTSTGFEIVLLGIIICNMIIMMFQHYDQSEQFSEVMNSSQQTQNFNRFFTAVFILELVSKLIALRLYYFKKGWNVFDFIIVIFSIIGLYFDESATKGMGNPSLLRVIRIFRIARLLRLLEFAKGVRQLLVALVISLPALLNIGTLLFLVIFIFAIIGMSTFGHIIKQGAIDDNVNFETFGNSMMLLFRLATGAGWNDILDALMVQPPDCDFDYGDDLPNGNCGFPLGAILYLVSYIIIVFLIIVNMYIAVILENVNRAQEPGDCIFKKDDLDDYYEKWESLVEGGKQYVSAHRLSHLVANLNEKFRIPQPNADILARLDIPIRIGDRVHCFDLLKALVKRLLQQQGESPQTFDQIAIRLEAQFKKSFSNQSPNLTPETNDATRVLQKATRVFTEKKRDTRREQLMMLHEIDKRRQMEAEIFNDHLLADECDSNFSDDSDLDRESLSYHLMLKNKISGGGYFNRKGNKSGGSANNIYGSTKGSNSNIYTGDDRGSTHNMYNDRDYMESNHTYGGEPVQSYDDIEPRRSLYIGNSSRRTPYNYYNDGEPRRNSTYYGNHNDGEQGSIYVNCNGAERRMSSPCTYETVDYRGSSPYSDEIDESPRSSFSTCNGELVYGNQFRDYRDYEGGDTWQIEI